MRIQRILKFDESTNIVSYKWFEENMKIRGVVFLSHGMAEHILRYDNFANFLVSKGFVVIGHDHYAHGASAVSFDKVGEDLGYDFMDAILKTMRLVKEEYEDEFSDVPFFAFSHSMGSMAMQRYIQKYPNDFSKVVISGTDLGKGKYGPSKMLTKLFMKKDKINYSKFINKIAMGSFNNKFRDFHPEFGWLTSQIDVVKDYENDPFCGKDFPVNYFYSLSCMMCDTVKTKNLKRINPKLKILLTGGSMDPVCNYGKAIKGLEKLYKKHGLSVTSKIYPNARHELHNEKEEVKNEFLNDVLNFYVK